MKSYKYQNQKYISLIFISLLSSGCGSSGGSGASVSFADVAELIKKENEIINNNNNNNTQNSSEEIVTVMTTDSGEKNPNNPTSTFNQNSSLNHPQMNGGDVFEVILPSSDKYIFKNNTSSQGGQVLDILEVPKVNPVTEVLYNTTVNLMDDIIDELEIIKEKYRKLDNVLSNQKYYNSQISEIQARITTVQKEYNTIEQQAIFYQQAVAAANAGQNVQVPAEPDVSKLQELSDEYTRLTEVLKEASEKKSEFELNIKGITGDAENKILLLENNIEEISSAVKNLLEQELNDLRKPIPVPVGSDVPDEERVKLTIKALSMEKEQMAKDIIDSIHEANNNLNNLDWSVDKSVFMPQNISATVDEVKKAKNLLKNIASTDIGDRARIIQKVYDEAGIAAKISVTDEFINGRREQVYKFIDNTSKIVVPSSSQTLVTNNQDAIDKL